MRVGLDLHTVTGLMQGSRTYMANLAARLPRAAPDIDFIYYVPDPTAVPIRELAAGVDNVSLRPIPKGRFGRLVWPFPARLRREVDVYHCQYVAPLVPCVPCVVTLHDILHETLPQYFPRGLQSLMRLAYPQSARRAAMVLTISQFSRDAIVTRYKVSPDRIAFAHLGVDRAFSPVTDTCALLAMRQRLDLPVGPYILFVGRLEPRKNLPGLVAAYRLVRQRLGVSAPALVLAGGRDVLFTAFHDKVRHDGVDEGIFFAGSVPQGDLPALYSGATALAYPSFGEGFGLPVIEAMACGAPVVATTAQAVPEVAGDAAIFVDPSDVAGLADALCLVATDAGLASRLAAKGLERARHFRWEEAVDLALTAYRRAVSGS
jgi:glycosyltransferase involved in cell wall biosynthesis